MVQQSFFIACESPIHSVTVGQIIHGKNSRLRVSSTVSGSLMGWEVEETTGNRPNHALHHTGPFKNISSPSERTTSVSPSRKKPPPKEDGVRNNSCSHHPLGISKKTLVIQHHHLNFNGWWNKHLKTQIRTQLQHLLEHSYWNGLALHVHLRCS